MTFSDDDLIAFHNGTFDPTKAQVLMQKLEIDDGLARRLMRLDPATQQVAETFAQIEPPAPANTNMAAQNTVWKPLALTASAMAVALAIWAILPPSGAAWHRQVAEYQVLYTAQTISMISPSPADLVDQFQTLDAALDIDFDQTTLVDIKGLDLLRAQILGFKGAPLGQIVFGDHLGRPIALCLVAGPDAAPLVQKQLAGLNTISWGSKTHQFLLVGPVPSHELQTWAEVLYQKL